MTEAEGRQFISGLVLKLNKAGFNIASTDIQNIDFFESDGICGKTKFATEHSYFLGINKKLLKENKLNYLKCVVYHELAHIIQYNEAISKNLIRYNESEDCIDIICEDVAVADELVFNNLHHTAFWQEIVNKINNKYNVVPKITAYLTQVELDKFLEGFFMSDRKRRNDPVVDYVISGMTLDDMMKYDIKPEYRLSADDVIEKNNEEQADKDQENK